MPTRSGLQRVREKKTCARSWDQDCASPAPVSIPVTVRLPVVAIIPVTSAANAVGLERRAFR
jgi:hypothetical protein